MAAASSAPFYHNIPGQRLILLGPPASGKGTQCEVLAERYGLVHISSGDLLRARIRAGDSRVKKYVEQGLLVPDELVTSLVLKRLAQTDCQQRGWILDGFPRSAGQARTLREEGLLATVDAVVVLDVEDSVLLQRIGGRRIDPVTKKVYHITHAPPPADAKDVWERLEQRADDTPVKIKGRIRDYYAAAAPILKEVEECVPDSLVVIRGVHGKRKTNKLVCEALSRIVTTRTPDRAQWQRSFDAGHQRVRGLANEFGRRQQKLVSKL